jgi:hypothetical protein
MGMTPDPGELVELARRLSRDEFVRTFDCPFLVAVDTQSPPPPLTDDDDSTVLSAATTPPPASARPPAASPIAASPPTMMPVRSARPHSSQITVGRSSANDIVIISPSVSKQHAAFVPSGAGWEVVDVGSRNGTSIGTRHLGPNERALLKSGDVIAFGYAPFFFLTAADTWARLCAR